jgi:hypothetical protein
MKTCPCCSNQLLRHFRHHQLYWFCQTCRQEMPVVEQPSLNLVSPGLIQQLERLSQPDRLSLPQTA